MGEVIEYAFRVKRDSDFYKAYMDRWRELDKMNKLVKVLMKERFGIDEYSFIPSERMCVKIDAESEADARAKKELTAGHNDSGMVVFKKNSPTQRKWKSDVIGNVDMALIKSMDLWYWDYMSKGQYALWHYKDDVYGLLASSEIKPPEFADRIKMSEYYQVIEERSSGS